VSANFEIKQKTKITVSIYGETFDMHKPTVEQVEALENQAKESDETDAKKFDSICNYLHMLGLPKEFSKKMEVDHLTSLITFISGEFSDGKKKSEAGQ